MIRMNRTARTLVASALMCLGGSSLMAEPMNLLENAEFRDLDEDGVPAGW